MDNIIFEVFNNICEGIIILNENLDILLWNGHMEYITGVSNKQAINSNLFTTLPRLNESYFKKAIDNVYTNESKMFFSAAMHKGLVNDKGKFNLKISLLKIKECKLVLLEFIDVTNQFERIDQLKKYLDELYNLNMELKEKENTINNLAYYDNLTGVANRTLFYKTVEKLFNNAERNDRISAMMFIDVDNFKTINDTYGHNVGDQILITVAKTLTECTRKGDIVARFGGDEFLIFLPFIKDKMDCKSVASRITNAKTKNVIIDGQQINISLSIGLSFSSKDGNEIDELISEADKAMYMVKGSGGNGYFSNY